MPVNSASPWERHGTLRISENGHFLQHADGTGFFWLGCTPWMLVQLTESEIEHYLTDRKAKGFNVLQVNVSNWLRGDAEGRTPFLGEGGRPYSSVRLNPYYWARIDAIVERAAAYGMYVAMVLTWRFGAHTPERRFFKDPAQCNYEYAQMLGTRYRDRPNVLWIACGEYRQPSDQPPTAEQREALRALARGVRDGGANGLLTFHPSSRHSSSEDWHDDEIADFNMIQTFGYEHAYRDLISRDYSLTPPKPTLNGEPAYEDRHLHISPEPRQPDWSLPEVVDDWQIRVEGYVSVFTGGCGYTYGHGVIYHFGSKAKEGRNWRQALKAPGSAQVQHLRSLIESKPILDRVPDNDLIGSREGCEDAVQNYIIATRDQAHTWAFVYTSKGYGFTLNMSRFKVGSVDASWFDPRTSECISAGRHLTQGNCTFHPPRKPHRGNDWVLILDTES